MQDFTDLKVWQRGHALVLEIYRISRAFPTDERFGLTSQLRRAAASVPANIAEGSKRQHPADYARFLNMAEGSLREVHYFLILARDLGYGAEKANGLFKEIDELSRMLSSLRAKVTRASASALRAAP